jgi:hypothetical protein
MGPGAGSVMLAGGGAGSGGTKEVGAGAAPHG